jgi:hypothetical protein
MRHLSLSLSPPLDPPLWCTIETKRRPILDTTGFFNFQDVYLDEVTQNTHSLLPYMYTRGLLVQYKSDLIIISLKINLFSQ